MSKTQKNILEKLVSGSFKNSQYCLEVQTQGILLHNMKELFHNHKVKFFHLWVWGVPDHFFGLRTCLTAIWLKQIFLRWLKSMVFLP